MAPMSSFSRYVWRILSIAPAQNLAFASQRERFFRAELILKVIYCFHIFRSLNVISNLNGSDLKGDIYYLPIVSFLNGIPFNALFFSINLFVIASAVFCILIPRYRFGRACFFIFFLLQYALHSGLGKVDHDSYPLLYLSFFVIFLPGGSAVDFARSRRLRQTYLLVFWWSSLMYFAFYFLAGLTKFFNGVLMTIIFKGFSHSWLNPESMGSLVAHFVLSYGLISPYLADFVIRNVWLGPFLIFGIIYTQFFLFTTLFRPRTSWIFGVLIIFFHLGSVLVMGIKFNHMAFGAVLLLFIGPFAERPASIVSSICDLPILSTILRLVQKRRSKT